MIVTTLLAKFCIRSATRLHCRQSSTCVTEFLDTNIDKYYKRFDVDWDGEHIIGDKMPTGRDICLQTNDYLSIGNHEKILSAKIRCLEQQKESNSQLYMSAAYLRGNENPYNIFEAAMAEQLGTEDAILCQSGYAANVGLIQSIANCSHAYPLMVKSNHKIPVYIDNNAHMSLREGIKSADALMVGFQHNNLTSLEEKVMQYGSGVIAVDSIYSTDGATCDIDRVSDIADEYRCALIIDESHSLGIYGDEGKSLTSMNALNKANHFITASLSKAHVSRAGIIGCMTRFKEFYKLSSYPAIFSSALLPYEIAGLVAGLEVIRKENWRREKLNKNAKHLRNNLTELGYSMAGNHSSPIIALQVGREKELIKMRKALEVRGIFGSAFFSPATSKNKCLMRFSVKTELDKNDIERILNACSDIKLEMQ